MLKYFGLFLVICSLISCKNESKVKLNETEFKKDSKKGNFFDFDEVAYYFKDINQNELFKNYEKSEFKDKQSDLYKYMQIVEGYYPEELNQKNFVKDLSDFEYKKIDINSSDFLALNSIFREVKCDDGFAMACTPVFRDILIFYNNNKIIGIAKICFGCRQDYIIGTNKNTSEFGQCGGFEALQDLLINYKHIAK